MIGKFKLTKEKALTIGIAVTFFVMIIEIVASEITNSLMLYSDGLHMMSHGLALGVSLIAIYISKRRKTQRAENTAAFINGVGLVLFTVYIFYEGIQKMYNPTGIMVNETILIAVLGLLVNLFTAYILAAGGLEDLNTKSAFLHLLADTFSSVAIILGAIIINYTDYFIIDAILSLIIGIVIAKWAVGLVASSYALLKSKKQVGEVV